MIHMHDSKLNSPRAIKAFLESSCNLDFYVPKSERYSWISDCLKRTNYLALNKSDKAIVKNYILKLTKLSRAQLTRLIARYRKNGNIVKKNNIRNRTCHYTKNDIALLAQTDKVHQTLNGAATKKLFERAFEIYKQKEYERLSHISIAHIYNLRKTKCYLSKLIRYNHTKAKKSQIGKRKKPNNHGKPGYIRIDTVHQGDQDSEKGVYHINATDEVTQFEIIGCIEKISEIYLIPMLEMMLASFPFVIINFHSDCGSEYINQYVVKLLNKLNIEFTKSRARHCNDNALAESKNNSVIRKHFNYIHIKQTHAKKINEFNKQYLIPYINYHRPCFFAKEKEDKKGKIKKVYEYKNMCTPFEKLKQINNVNIYLKKGVTIEQLEKIALQKTDLEAAKELFEAEKKLFQTVIEYSKETT